tara:strand:+ start:245 stop:619 length:375 start_codon:yes stop_codon:yes gene_type:complete
MKSIIAAGVIVGSLSAPAFAGPYANVENNAAWIGSEFEIGVTEVHAGYEIEAGEDVAIYVQAGPAFISIEDEDLETEISGYIGITADVSDSFELYCEVGFLTADQEFDTDTLSVSTEVGATYRF